jgi:Transposase
MILGMPCSRTFIRHKLYGFLTSSRDRTLSLTFEEGTSAAWLHDLLEPDVSRLVVCDPRKNALLQDGNKSDRVDARKLAELLRTNQLKSVYHGEHGIRALKELGQSYVTLTKDVTRVMNRIKALYRSWAIPCSGSSVYAPRHRSEWLAKLVEPGVGSEPSPDTPCGMPRCVHRNPAEYVFRGENVFVSLHVYCRPSSPSCQAVLLEAFVSGVITH